MDDNRVLLGSGEASFARARQAIMQWRMCNLGWATICGRDKPIATGTVILLELCNGRDYPGP